MTPVKDMSELVLGDYILEYTCNGLKVRFAFISKVSCLHPESLRGILIKDYQPNVGAEVYIGSDYYISAVGYTKIFKLTEEEFVCHVALECI